MNDPANLTIPWGYLSINQLMGKQIRINIAIIKTTTNTYNAKGLSMKIMALRIWPHILDINISRLNDYNEPTIVSINTVQDKRAQ